MIGWLLILQVTALSHADGEIRIARDRWGVPHVGAPTARAAFYAQGYVEAEDRIHQMDRLRRAALGTLCEVEGEGALRSDVSRRRTGYTVGELGEMMAGARERLREGMNAYADGVNAYLGEHAELGFRAWQATDSVAIGVMMARRFGQAGDVELEIGRLYQALAGQHGEERARDILLDILPGNDPAAPATLGDHLRVPAFVPAAPEDSRWRPTPIPEELWARREAEREAVREIEDRLGIPTYGGSNAWVVSPRLSAEGAAMLFGGPMMGFRTPSIADEVGLACPDFGAYGMSFPGVPGILIGHNQWCAWTTTSGSADLVDFYELDLNPENPEEYRHGGGWVAFEKREEIFRVGEEERRETFYRTPEGPVVEIDRERNKAYVQRMSFWKRESGTYEGFFVFQFARSLDEFRRGVGEVVTSHNILYADRDGTIACWYAGRHPVRRPEHDPRFAPPGDGSMDWAGFVPFEEWPQGVNPEQGFFANWNNKPARDWQPTPFGKIFWGKRILDILESGERIDRDRCWDIAREAASYSFIADYVLGHLLAAIEGEEEFADVARMFAEWDRYETSDSPAPLVLWRWVESLQFLVFGPTLGPLAGQRDALEYLGSTLLAVLEGPASHRELRVSYLEGRDRDDVIRQALRRALERIRREKGDDPAGWRDVPSIDFGPNGRVASPDGRGTYKILVVMSDPPRAVSLLPPGQSEDPESPHYADQLPLFGPWAYKEVEAPR